MRKVEVLRVERVENIPYPVLVELRLENFGLIVRRKQGTKKVSYSKMYFGSVMPEKDIYIPPALFHKMKKEAYGILFEKKQIGQEKNLPPAQQSLF